MFARFRNLFGKAKADGPPEQPAETPLAKEAEAPQAPLASEEEDSDLEAAPALSPSDEALCQLLDEIIMSSSRPFAEEEHVEDDDDTASTSSDKTKIAKASIERDIIIEKTLDEQEEEEQPEQELQPGLHSLDKIKALIRNDSETYPQSDYTDNSETEATPLHSRTSSLDYTGGAEQLQKQSKPSNLVSSSCDYSIVPDELPLDNDISSPSPLHDSGRNSSAGSTGGAAAGDSPSTLSVTPTGNNELACAAISHKLSAIAEVAESLDAVIRDCGGGDLDVSSHKKLGSNGMSSEVSQEEYALCAFYNVSFLSRIGNHAPRKMNHLPPPPRAISRPTRTHPPFRPPHTLVRPRTPSMRQMTPR